MRAGVIALLLCFAFGRASGVIAQDETIITDGLTQITEELCKDDGGLFYIPDGSGWQVYGIDYWQPLWIDFSEYPSLQKLKANATLSANPCVVSELQYGVHPLHVTVTLDLLSGELILRPACSSEKLASVTAPKGYQPGQWPADCRVVERLWQDWQKIQSAPYWQEWYGKEATPFLTFHFQLADLICDKPAFEKALATEEAAWLEAEASATAAPLNSGKMAASPENEGGGMTAMLMGGGPCSITNEAAEFAVLGIERDTNGWTILLWESCVDHLYQPQAASEMLPNTAWEPQYLMIGDDGYSIWTDTNSPPFEYRFYRIRRLAFDGDADGDGLLNIDEYGLGADIDNPDTDGDGILDGDEVNVHGTNPLNPDSDDDFWLDGAEILEGYNPTNSANFPDFSFTVNGGADVATNAQLHIDLATGLIADYTIVSEDITFTSSITNAFATSFDYTLVSTNDGMHMVFLMLMKASGTTSPQFGHMIELDTHAPTISITSPTNGVVISRRRINIEGFAADAATNALSLDASRPVFVAVNGIQANDRDAGGLWWAGLHELIPGTNEFVAVVTDRAGFAASNSVFVIYDSTLATNTPSFTLDVTNEVVVVGATTTDFALMGSIDDDNAIVQIDVVDASDPTITNATINAAVSGTNWWTQLPVFGGSNLVLVSTFNPGSPTNTTGFLLIQDTNVWLEITRPAANTAVNASQVTVLGRASTNFNGAITINGQVAATVVGSDSITFSNAVPIPLNEGVNIMEVHAEGSDGSSATVRQIVYGYEVVRYFEVLQGDLRHVNNDCWFTHKYPYQHWFRNEYYGVMEWNAPAVQYSHVGYDNYYTVSGELIPWFGGPINHTHTWDPDFVFVDGMGWAYGERIRDGKHLSGAWVEPTSNCAYTVNCDCPPEDPYCEGLSTLLCCVAQNHEDEVSHDYYTAEVTFIKHWPTDEEQTVLLHFGDVHLWWYDDDEIDPASITFWGQPGILHSRTEWDSPNVGFIVKIKTNTRYTISEKDFTFPSYNDAGSYHWPNPQSIVINQDSAHMLQYWGIANTLVDLAIQGVSEKDEDGDGGLLPVNLHFDEGNKVDPFANPEDMDVLVPDNVPDQGENHRITLRDSDLRRATITIADSNDTRATGTWRLEFDSQKIKFWMKGQDANYTEITPNTESQTIALPFKLEMLAEGIQADANAHVKLVFTPAQSGRLPLSDDVKLRICEFWIQDVTTEPGTLPIVNPAGIGIDKTATFKLTMLTESIAPPGEIEWTITAGGDHASIEGSNKGRSVTVKGTSEGEITLIASWKGFKDQIRAKIVPARTVDLSIVIVSTDNQPAHAPYYATTPGGGWTVGATAAKVQEHVDRANAIYAQWNLHFNIRTQQYIVVNSYDWGFYGEPFLANLTYFVSHYEEDRLGQDIDSNNTSIEVYYFKSFGGEPANGITSQAGISMNNALAILETLGHEVMHTFRKASNNTDHNFNFREALYYKAGLPNRWDISLSEANGFINFHSDW